tara:strand:- start:191 stop:1042 length:852 start_codon:yes stop_codon:yes gene_type:complete
MITIDREQMIAEELIREHVRKRISQKIHLEQVVRNRVKQIITEAEAGTDEPSTYTGINVLANLLEKIVPVIEDDYKMLTTSEEQRESFRNHMVHAIKNTLRPIDSSTEAEKVGSQNENLVYTLDKALLEKMKIDLSPEDDDAADEVSGEFIDIAAPEDDDFVQISDQNETGRNFAATTFKQVEKQIVDAYDMLADEKDQNLFYDYLITNMLLYFDKFEDELQETLPSVTTPEYEQAKDEEEQEDSEPASEPLATDSAAPVEEPAETEAAPEEEEALGGPSGDS